MIMISYDDNTHNDNTHNDNSLDYHYDDDNTTSGLHTFYNCTRSRHQQVLWSRDVEGYQHLCHGCISHLEQQAVCTVLQHSLISISRYVVMLVGVLLTPRHVAAPAVQPL